MTDISPTKIVIDDGLVSNAPVAGKARIRSIDTLRGVALLGILLMNIIAFGLPFASYFNPVYDASLEGINLSTFMVMDVFVEGSMRAIFSMLFGAGLLLFVAKPGADEERVRGLYYRRTGLLMLFGLCNAYVLLWPGDILFAYGAAGLLLYFFRDMTPRQLANRAVMIFTVLALLHAASQTFTMELQREVAAVEMLSPEIELSEEQLDTLARWDSFLEQQFVSPASIEADLAVRKRGYWDIFLFLAPVNLLIQTQGLIFGSLWDALAMMLLGMALMKWGVFDASRSVRFYATMAFLGFGVGLPINYAEVNALVLSDFAMSWTAGNRITYDLGRLLLAFGYIGITMLVCKFGLLSRLRAALAAVGQMALTNYLAQTIICNTLFMGWGFNLFAELERYQLYYVVLGVWLFQLLFSPWWLRRFRYGPAEWLWRSATYGSPQPMRLQAA